MAPDALQHRIAERAGALTPRLREAAEFVCAHPHEVATRSLRHVARSAGLTPATLSRLARALGYPRYESLRDTCRRQIAPGRETLAERAGRLGSARRDTLEDSVAAAAEHLQALRAGVDDVRLADVVRRLHGARRVVALGSMSSGALIDYVGHVARMAFSNWQAVGLGTGVVADALAGLGRDDAMLVVSLSPYARRTLECARAARDAGAWVVAITDRVDSPLLGIAAAGLLVDTDGPHFFPSHVATMVLLEAILGMLVRLDGDRARRRIAAVEKISRALGEYREA